MPCTHRSLISRRGALAAAASLLVLFALATGTSAGAQEARARFINPAGLSKPTGYTHVVVAADGRTVHIAGQVALDSTGKIVGPGDFRAQAERAFTNVRTALASVGASFTDVVKTTIFVTDIANVPTFREVRTKYVDAASPPASTLVAVASLARPEFMIEIEAVAVLRAPWRP